jgi:hypothetical protein
LLSTRSQELNSANNKVCPRSSGPDRAEPITGLHIVRPAANYEAHYLREATLRAVCAFDI